MPDDHLDIDTCEHCGEDYTYDVTHTGEIHCPHCKRRVKVQIGSVDPHV